jgi:hypothetical protein
MLYINDPKQPHYLYDDVVDMAIKNGIKPKSVYIYLAGIGVKGTLARIQSSTSMDYLQPAKVAVKDNKLVVSVSVCKHCNSLIVE